MSWLILGAIMGMVTVFRYVISGGGAVFPQDYGPSEQLIAGAIGGALFYGVPSYLLYLVLSPAAG